MVDAPSHGGWALSTQEVTIKKIMLLLAALITGLATLVFPNTASNANSSWGPQFSQTGWWNELSQQNQNGKHWTYPNFPINCFAQTGPTSDRAFKAVYVHMQGTTPAIQDPAVMASIQEAARRASSIYSASAKKTFGTVAQAEQNLSPRFETVAPAAGQTSDCNVSFAIEAIPLDKFPQHGSTPNETAEFFQHMSSLGYSQGNRKYVYFVQQPPQNSWSTGGQAYTENARNEPGLSNWHNTASTPLYVNLDQDYAYANDGYWLTNRLSTALAHEMSHSLGAALNGSPNQEPGGSAHVSDCGDLLCAGAGQTYENNCGTKQQVLEGTARASYRLDCNRDDYFNVDSPAWQNTRWNSAQSSFLWGNPQP